MPTAATSDCSSLRFTAQRRRLALTRRAAATLNSARIRHAARTKIATPPPPPLCAAPLSLLARLPHGCRTRAAAVLGGGLRCALHICLRPLQDGRVLRRALPARALARAQAALQGAGGSGRRCRGGSAGCCCRRRCCTCCGRWRRWRGQAARRAPHARRLHGSRVPRAGLPLRAGDLQRSAGGWRRKHCVLWVPLCGVLRRGVPGRALAGAHG